TKNGDGGPRASYRCRLCSDWPARLSLCTSGVLPAGSLYDSFKRDSTRQLAEIPGKDFIHCLGGSGRPAPSRNEDCRGRSTVCVGKRDCSGDFAASEMAAGK
ncbi:hypothetical protein PV326_011040, partial [Microctonus aethiopoides]